MAVSISMYTLMTKLMENAANAGLPVMLLMIAIVICGGAIATLWKNNLELHKKVDELHGENQELLREMIDLGKEYGEEKTRLVEEINKTIMLLLATTTQQAKRD